MTKKTFTATLPGYAMQIFLDKVLGILDGDATEEKINKSLSCIYASDSKYIKENGDYIPVGTVEIKFTPLDVKDMVAGQVSALEAQIKKIKAEAQLEVMKLQDKIANLQALTYEAKDA